MRLVQMMVNTGYGIYNDILILFSPGILSQ